MQAKLITIIYPCFNQPEVLAQSLHSLDAQTSRAFKVLLLDDCSERDYSGVIQEFAHLDITQIVNSQNLGAVPNMLHGINYPVDTPYKMVFHEDDLLHPRWIETALVTFQQNPGIGWVGCTMSFFENTLDVKFNDVDNDTLSALINDTRQLARNIIEGQSFSFASIVYDAQVSKHASLPLDQFSMLGDRYLLLELAKQFGFAYYSFDFIAAHSHTGVDTRWKSMKPKHIVQFLMYMKSFFSDAALSQKSVRSGFTRYAIGAVALLPSRSVWETALVYRQLYRQGIFSVKYLLLCWKPLRHFLDFLFHR